MGAEIQQHLAVPAQRAPCSPRGHQRAPDHCPLQQSLARDPHPVTAPAGRTHKDSRNFLWYPCWWCGRPAPKSREAKAQPRVGLDPSTGGLYRRATTPATCAHHSLCPAPQKHNLGFKKQVSKLVSSHQDFLMPIFSSFFIGMMQFPFQQPRSLKS